MKMIDDVIIIGIDSGYGNIKTANCCFPNALICIRTTAFSTITVGKSLRVR